MSKSSGISALVTQLRRDTRVTTSLEGLAEIERAARAQAWAEGYFAAEFGQSLANNPYRLEAK